jgi:hypothetical protein
MSVATKRKADKPSPVPSWVMLGFIIGVLTMWAFQSGQSSHVEVDREPVSEIGEGATGEAEVEGESNPLAREDQPSIELVAAVFDQLSEYAFWAEGRTEIAMWNGKTLSFSDHFEVLRVSDRTFFRPITGFTRLPLEGYGPDDSPILFTETPEQRAARYFRAHPDLAPDTKSRAPVEFDDLPSPPEPVG